MLDRKREMKLALIFPGDSRLETLISLLLLLPLATAYAIGETVFYGRGGGELSGPWHGSSYVCPPYAEADSACLWRRADSPPQTSPILPTVVA